MKGPAGADGDEGDAGAAVSTALILVHVDILACVPSLHVHTYMHICLHSRGSYVIYIITVWTPSSVFVV